MTERQIHQAFNVWLRERQIPFVEARMDCRSTIAKSWPDYSIFWLGHALMLEIKTARGKLSPGQAKMIDFIRRSGNKVEVVRSVGEAVEACHNILLQGAKLTGGHPGHEKWPLENSFRDLKQTVSEVPANGSNGFYVGSWHGTNYVFARGQDGAYAKIREASAIDIANLPKVPA